MISSNFNGLKSRTVFSLWTGLEPLSTNRIQALWSIFSNIGCPVAYITQETLLPWVVPDQPLHKAYAYLSSVHKSDYLRCYLMHHFGGGYTDIKFTSKNWGQFFSDFEHSEKLALGYQELAHGIPHVSGALGDEIRASHRELIGLCAFIFKPRTQLTYTWFERITQLLDKKYDELVKYPAQHPMDQKGVILPDGQVSQYPLRWAELLGEIFHPLIYQERDKLLIAPIEPIFHSYR